MAFCAASATTCDDSDDPIFPSAPTSLTSGIAVYEGTNFSGTSAYIDRDAEDLTRYRGPCEESEDTMRSWDDCVSSIRVAAGVTAVIFVDTGFKGFAVTIDRDVGDLGLIVGPCHRGSMNNCVSLI